MYPTPEHELQIHPKQVLCRRHLNVVVDVDANANQMQTKDVAVLSATRGETDRAHFTIDATAKAEGTDR
jgi:hypothetical protein